jgi:hypothetical protein
MLSKHGSARIFSTESSSVLLAHDQGFIQDVTLHLSACKSNFALQLRVNANMNADIQERMLFIEKDAHGALMVCEKSIKDGVTRFVVDRTVVVAGRRWWVMDSPWKIGDGVEMEWSVALGGDVDSGSDSDCAGSEKCVGQDLWIEWVTEEEKNERAKRSRWGIWMPKHEISWK